MANTAKTGKVPVSKTVKPETKVLPKSGKVINLKSNKQTEPAATLDVTPDREFFNKIRTNNVRKFKDNIREHIIDLEVTQARINIEEKLLNCGNVTYLTEQEVIQDHQTATKNKEYLEITSLLIATAISLGVYLYLTRRAIFVY